MGLLDSVIGAAAGALFKQGGANPEQLAGLVNELLQQVGGLPGLVQKFQAGGLGEIVASWIGQGENRPVSADQLRDVVGGNVLDDLAGKAGLDSGLFGTLLAKGLPSLVSHLTPDGQVPADGGKIDVAQAGDLIGKLLGRG